MQYPAPLENLQASHHRPRHRPQHRPHHHHPRHSRHCFHRHVNCVYSRQFQHIIV